MCHFTAYRGLPTALPPRGGRARPLGRARRPEKMIYAVDSPLFQSFLSSGKHKPSSEEIIAALADISKKHPGSKPEQHVGGGAVLRRFLDVAAFALARPRPGTRSRAALAPAARRPGSAVAGGGIIFVRAPHSAARVERFPRRRRRCCEGSIHNGFWTT